MASTSKRKPGVGSLDLWLLKRPRNDNATCNSNLRADSSQPSSTSGSSQPLSTGGSLQLSSTGGENVTTLPQAECQSTDASVVEGASTKSTSQVVAKHKPVVDIDKMKKLFKDHPFPNPDSKVHQFYICGEKGCISLTHEDTMQRDRPNKRQEYFSHNWLLDPEIAYCEITGVWWLVYQENVGMFCLLCRKHNTTNLQNKAVEYNQKPAVRFRKRAVQYHAESAKHKAARQAELTSRVSVFETLYQERENTRVSTIRNAFWAACWLAKEELPNIKLYSLIGLFQKAGVEQMKYFTYNSQGIAREIFLTLGEIVRGGVADKVNEANCYGILTDEVTDIATLEVIVTFIQYVSKGAEVHTDFLFADNLLAESDSANAETIVSVLKENMEKLDISPECMTSFVSDGSSVMTGRTNGVAAKLKQDVNPALISIHCVCHRLALACTDTISDGSLRYINKVHDWLVSLWKFFEGSPKRLSVYFNMQMKVRGIELAIANAQPSESVSESSLNPRSRVERRLKKACSKRWLLFDHSVKSVYQDYVAVLLTLNHLADSQPKARGLLAEFRTPKFLGVVYILHHILPVLSILSKSLQTSDIHHSALQPAIDKTLDQLKHAANSKEPITSLRKDMDPETGRLRLISKFGDHPDQVSENEEERDPGIRDADSLRSQLRKVTGNGITLTGLVEDDLTRLLEKYVLVLSANIVNRFNKGLEILKLFSIFDPVLLPMPCSPGFSKYGDENITKIGKHFFNNDVTKCEQLHAEWNLFKYQMVRWWKPEFEQEISVTPTVWCLKRLLALKSSLQYDILCYLVEVSLAAPISNAWPERGASAIKRIKTRLRSSLNMTMLDSLLQISVNGPEVNSSESAVVVDKAVEKFLNKKKRVMGKMTCRSLCNEVSRQTTETVQKGNVDEQNEQLKLTTNEAIVALGLDEYSESSECDSE